MQTKTCAKCKQELPLTAYTKDSSRPDGLFSYCRACKNAVRKSYNIDREKMLAAKTRYNRKRRAQKRADGTIEEEYRQSREAHRRRRESDPEFREKARQRASDWYHSLSKDERRAKKQQYKENDPDFERKKRDQHLRKLYGLTVDKYDEMWNRQGGCCSICGRHENQFRKRLFVDHCHTTGNVRELLCAACNFLVGTMETTPDTVAKATEYLERHT